MSGELILLIVVIVIAAIVVLPRLIRSRSVGGVPPAASTTKPSKPAIDNSPSRGLDIPYQSIDQQEQKLDRNLGKFDPPQPQPMMPPASVPPPASPPQVSPSAPPPMIIPNEIQAGRDFVIAESEPQTPPEEADEILLDDFLLDPSLRGGGGEEIEPDAKPEMPAIELEQATPPSEIPDWLKEATSDSSAVSIGDKRSDSDEERAPNTPPRNLREWQALTDDERKALDEAEMEGGESDPEPEMPQSEILDDFLLDPSLRGGGSDDAWQDDDLIEFEEVAPPPPPRPIVPPSREETAPPPTPQAPPQTSETPPAPVQNETPAEVQFAAYYPKEVQPEEWKPLTAYIYKSFAATQIAEDVKKQLGTQLAGMRSINQGARQPVQEGALITATPHMDGFQFNPPSISVGFYEDWHRLDFKVRAKGAPLNQATNGVLTFSVEGIIVADIPLAIFVGEKVTEGDTATASSKPYQAIFCSYSHRDEFIVKRVERAYKALGLDYLRDVYTLKSGQDWDDQLLKLIDNADIFQLFWSKTAAESKFVRQEWEHALKLKRDSLHFIRPVYWEEPIPDVPSELGHIHFAFQPELDDK